MRIGLWEDTSQPGAYLAGRFAALLQTIRDADIYSLRKDALPAETLDAAIVCAALAGRLEAVSALAGGVPHLLVPAPLSAELGRTQAALADCDTRNTAVQPMFRYRALPILKTLRQIIHEGALGEIFGFQLSLHRRSHAEPGDSSALLPVLPHALDLLRWLLNSGVAEAVVEYGNADAALLSLQLDDGAYAVLDLGALLPDGSPYPESLKLTITGLDGTAEVDVFGQKLRLCTDGEQSLYWGSDPDLELLRAFILQVTGQVDGTVSRQDLLWCEGMTSRILASAGAGVTVRIDTHDL